MNRRDIEQAFIDAFDEASLTRVVRRVGKRLDVVAGGENYQELVSNLIAAAIREGWVSKLVLTAALENPGNQRLRDLIESSEWRTGERSSADVNVCSDEVVAVDDMRMKIAELERTVYGFRNQAGMIEQLSILVKTVERMEQWQQRRSEQVAWQQWALIVIVAVDVVPAVWGLFR